MQINFNNSILPHIKFSKLLLVKRPKNKQPELMTNLLADKFERSVYIPDFAKINKSIEAKEEYLELLNMLKTVKTNGGFQYAYFTEMNNCLYDSVEDELQGLLPYCGVDDSSKLINMYLSGRFTQKEYKDCFCAMPANIETLPDVIRVLEYSLKQLDKKYGKYNGIVYRQGFMDEKPCQYISATQDCKIASRFKNFAGSFQPHRKYSIIKVENGHKINEFQKRASDVGREFARKEQEILLPFENQYKKLSNEELTNDMLGRKMLMASYFFDDAIKLFTGEEHMINGYTADNLLNMIDVYVQI